MVNTKAIIIITFLVLISVPIIGLSINIKIFNDKPKPSLNSVCLECEKINTEYKCFCEAIFNNIKYQNDVKTSFNNKHQVLYLYDKKLQFNKPNVTLQISILIMIIALSFILITVLIRLN